MKSREQLLEQSAIVFLTAQGYTVHRSLFRAVRIKAGLSQVQLAKLCECSQSNIAQIETGTRKASAQMKAKWADACGVDVGCLSEARTDD